MKNNSRSSSTPVVAATCLVAGVVLIGVSFLPLRSVADRYWTEEDSVAYDRISLEYHRAAYEPPARTGRSEAEMQAYRDGLRERYEAMREKLAKAGRQPDRWRRILLWSGALVATMGAVVLIYRQPSR